MLDWSDLGDSSPRIAFTDSNRLGSSTPLLSGHIFSRRARLMRSTIGASFESGASVVREPLATNIRVGDGGWVRRSWAAWRSTHVQVTSLKSDLVAVVSEEPWRPVLPCPSSPSRPP